jgi:galactonate dehydratase
VRIVGIEPVTVGTGWINWVFVRLHTDEGLVGIGEATLEGQTEAVLASLRELEPIVVGEDAARITHIWEQAYRHSFYRGGPARMSAISGVDQALWDLRGKALGVPVYDLLGGRVRDAVRLYANGPRGDTRAELAASAVGLRDAGFNAMKLAPAEPTALVAGAAPVALARDRTRAVREAVGSSTDVAVDFHGRLSPSMAIRIGRAIDDLDLLFIEEPALPDNLGGIATVARSLTTPIATGERLLGRHPFQALLTLDACALVQPDLAHVGGISEGRIVAAMADVQQVGLAPHNPLGPVNTAASAHLAMATPNFVILEYLADSPVREEILATPFDIADGHLHVSDQPGLGIELDLERCLRFPPRDDARLPAPFHADGSVADW